MQWCAADQPALCRIVSIETTHPERDDSPFRQTAHCVRIPHLGILFVVILPSTTRPARCRLAFGHQSLGVINYSLETTSCQVKVPELIRKTRRRILKCGANEGSREHIGFLRVQAAERQYEDSRSNEES